METFGVLTKYPDSVALIEFTLGSVWLWEFRIVSTPCHCSYISVVSSERTGALGLGVALRYGSTASSVPLNTGSVSPVQQLPMRMGMF